MSADPASAPDPADRVIAVLAELNRIRFERIERADGLRALDDLVLCPPAAGRPGLPRAVTYLCKRDGRAWLFARDRVALEALEPDQLAWAIAEGMVFAARPGLLPAGIDPEALGSYARRHALEPAAVGAHLAGRVSALRAVRRELSALADAADSEAARAAIEWAGRRLDRLLNEAGAAATGMVRRGA